MFAAKLSAYALAGALLASPLAIGASVQRRAVAYFDPTAGGGSMFADAGNGLGEPLNVIISGLSSPDVLTEDGLINYAQAIGFSTECFGIHLGNPFPANLGDGHGPVNQTVELRQDYGDEDGGTCLESLIGGNHFRVFFQNGPSANSGAAFLAVSKEEPVTDNHDIVPDGYDIGRDTLVQSAVGITSNDGVTYSTTAQNITGLLPTGTEGVNHDIAIDGIVTLLTVTIQ
ncbi:hypothetical protein BD309DRAFT_960762 [Dichomitus squalens]|uniref:Uncharacterized protein n=1 Tax=Dichomitus squalens TaxID=114155 RepID=A0A4Q9MPU9_9APHY|nr:uncharacterized protein DICSQDRAFT_51829 [Dichomitus squalens LYAD-421 SS1]EJF65127.1 hypothetical protein DICSQDRAFT_51829 [Dichomitus squalens LYAD-421 SS1]TBU29545.1 hypothetical protein BD311DRAFT_720294 [Dichomitus squalens]TBU43397.1 hypothetical protein BD309DRAFT_960762 [Dichomitus squalens]TBU64560.1 hypothetical protein BD310DRAFT_914866 [Dichomitus squalens]